MSRQRTLRPEHPTLGSASELWAALVERGGLDLKLYDAPLVAELAERLEIPVAEFPSELDRYVTSTALINAFLRAGWTFALMAKDILELYGRAGTSQGNENLRVRVDFDGLEAIDIDLSVFKELERRWRRALASVSTVQVDAFGMHDVSHAFVERGVTDRVEHGIWISSEPDDEVYRRWSTSLVLSDVPPPPPTADAELNQMLGVVWTLLEQSMLRIREAEDDSLANTPVFSLDDVIAIVRRAYLLAGRPSALRDRLKGVLDRFPKKTNDEPALLEFLDEIFSMPVWKRRNDVYAVWVGSRIVHTMGARARIHTVDGVLAFSTRQRHFASLTCDPESNLHLMTEPRTPLVSPRGKKRKRGIQPDYVLMREPVTEASSGVAVVECKQYLRSATEEFVAAVYDYVRGYPDARVVLVNYGPIGDAVTRAVSALPPEMRDRIVLIPHFYPGSARSLTEFEREMEALLPAQRHVEKALSVAGNAAHAVPGRVTLSWKANVDLDLHCRLMGSDLPAQHIYYGNKSASGGIRAHLNQDVQDGSSPECFEFEFNPDHTLIVGVHNYSGSLSFEVVSAVVTLSRPGSTVVLQVPAPRSGGWWCVFKYEMSSDTVTVYNAIVADPSSYGFQAAPG